MTGQRVQVPVVSAINLAKIVVVGGERRECGEKGVVGSEQVQGFETFISGVEDRVVEIVNNV